MENDQCLLKITQKTTNSTCLEPHFDGLVQKRRNSIANALELRLSCTELSI